MFNTKFYFDVHLTFLVAHFIIFCVADFIIDETEEHTKCIPYNTPQASLYCIFKCPFDCSGIGYEKKNCDPVQFSDKHLCCCKKNVKISQSKCEDRCLNYNYGFSYDDMTLACKCVCSETVCASFCSRTDRFGKCQDLKNQQLMNNPCKCYCDETCAFKFNSKYINAECNKLGQCIKTCNGTQEIGPTWCVLNNNKCGCTCSKEKCTTFCKNKTIYGICHSSSLCNCQYSMFTDVQCNSYCRGRTGRPAKLIPTETGHCKCNYNPVGSVVCQRYCLKSNVCSKIDGCFCKDNNESIAELHNEVNRCKEQVCYQYTYAVDVKRDTIVVTLKPDGFNGIICMSRYYLKLGKQEIIIPGVFLRKTVPNAESIPSNKICYMIYNDVSVVRLVSLKVTVFVLGNQTNFFFKKMKQNGKIPKNAVKFRDYFYFGRAFGGEVLGTISDKGVMVGGNISLMPWINQKPIIPSEFEIFVCNTSISETT